MDGKGLPKSYKCEQDRNFVNLGIVQSLNVPSMKRCLKSRKSKDSSKASATPDQYINSWPCPVSLRVITFRPNTFCSWLIEPTLRKHSCNII